MTGHHGLGRATPDRESKRGRGRPSGGHALTVDVSHVIMDVANLPIKLREPGYQRRRTVTLFEMLVRALAEGRSSRRRSVLPFIRLTIAAARRIEAAAMPVAALPAQADDPAAAMAALERALNGIKASGTDVEIEAALDRYLDGLRHHRQV